MLSKLFTFYQFNQLFTINKFIIFVSQYYQFMTTFHANKTKAADLKRIIQQACKVQTQTPLTEIPLKTNKELIKNKNNKKQIEEVKGKESERSNKSSNLITQLKQLNMKKGLNSSQNTIDNLNKSTKNMKLTTSVICKQNYNLEKNLKNAKLNSSTQSIKSIKKISTPDILTHQKKHKVTNDTTLIKQINQKKSLEQIHIPKKLCLEDFRLGKKLGKGKFGNVYMTEYIPTKFRLAIKIVNLQQLKQSSMEKQLIQQIKLQTYMNHPNLLKMYGYFTDQTNIYLLLELANSCLFSQLRNKKCYSEEMAAYYIKQVIQGLKSMHSQNIIHRDIKPENILINQGVVKICDFGWSIYSPVHKRQTFCGTLDYVSPQIVQGYYYDQKVDIWSLGVLCYQLVTGKAPFQVQNDQQSTYDKILSVAIDFSAQMSLQLKDLISKILIKQPRQRLSLCEIQNHAWLRKYNKVGRFINKSIWEAWEKIK